MKVSDFMTRSVVTITMDDPLSLASDIFKRTRFHHLLVVEKGVLFGVLSDRDLLKAMSPNIGTVAETAKDVATLNKRVHQVMTRKPITLDAEDDLSDAVELFRKHSVSCIPVIDSDRQPTGIVSWRDVLNTLAA